MTRATALILCLGMTFGSALAVAADDAMVPGEIGSRIRALEPRQSRIDPRGPAIGTVSGGAMTGIGASLGAAAAIQCGESGACSPEHIIGLGVSAAVLTIAGVAS